MRDSIYRLETGEYVDLASINLISKTYTNTYHFESLTSLYFKINLQLGDPVEIHMNKYVSYSDGKETNSDEFEKIKLKLVNAWTEHKGKQ